MNVQENVDQVVQDEHFDQNIFLSLKFSQLYDCLLLKDLTWERGILLDILEAQWFDFYRRLRDRGWMCFPKNQ